MYIYHLPDIRTLLHVPFECRISVMTACHPYNPVTVSLAEWLATLEEETEHISDDIERDYARTHFVLTSRMPNSHDISAVDLHRNLLNDLPNRAVNVYRDFDSVIGVFTEDIPPLTAALKVFVLPRHQGRIT
jgi:hypothetical protein